MSEQVRDYDPDDKAFNVLAEISRGMFASVRPEGSSCAVMCALLAMCLEDPLGGTIAGALKVDGDYMYGSNRAIDGKRVSHVPSVLLLLSYIASPHRSKGNIRNFAPTESSRKGSEIDEYGY